MKPSESSFIPTWSEGFLRTAQPTLPMALQEGTYFKPGVISSKNLFQLPDLNPNSA